jgi:hypothetical protein
MGSGKRIAVLVVDVRCEHDRVACRSGAVLRRNVDRCFRRGECCLRTNGGDG